jgi:hypothetical protein
MNNFRKSQTSKKRVAQGRRVSMITSEFNLKVQHRQNRFAVASGCEHSILKLRPNLSFQSWPLHLLATASSSALRQTLTDLSLRWSEEKSFGGRAFYKHFAPKGARSHKTRLHFKVESTTDE